MKISVFLCLGLSLFLLGCRLSFNDPKADMTIAYPAPHSLMRYRPRSHETMVQLRSLPDTAHMRDSFVSMHQ